MSAAPPHVLSIDLGTSGPKVALVSETGTLVASTSRRIPTVRLPGDGAEQDADAIWDTVCDAIREVVARASIPPERIVGIGLVAQFFSLVPVDADAKPTHPLLLWMDGRGAPDAQVDVKVRGGIVRRRVLDFHGEGGGLLVDQTVPANGVHHEVGRSQ